VVACVVPGPRQNAFDPEALKVLLDARFRVSPQSNHVGLRLDGERIPAPPRGSRVSEPMPVGGVQITPSGQPIILLSSRGTIGGYPLLATVTMGSVWALGQARPGDEIRFRSVTPAEARESTIAMLREDVELIGGSL
jgi:allophanate hydrolase subunit 2